MRRAGNQHCVCPRRAGNVGGLHFACRLGGLVGHRAVVEKIAQRPGLDGKIDILRNIAGRLDDPQRIELGSDHAENIAAIVVQKPAAVARLNGALIRKKRVSLCAAQPMT